MRKLLGRQVVSEASARRICWGAAFLLLAACTALVLAALPTVKLAASIALVASVAVGWVVLGGQLAKL
jgi:hypothetical protein